jgi:hypothetical protein
MNILFHAMTQGKTQRQSIVVSDPLHLSATALRLRVKPANKEFHYFICITIAFLIISFNSIAQLSNINPGHYDTTWWNRTPIRLIQNQLTRDRCIDGHRRLCKVD